MRIRRVLFALASVASLMLAGVRAIGAPQDPGPQPSRAGEVTLAVELPGAPTAGARLFVEKRCVVCHGIGEGQKVGPDLGRIHLRGSVLDLAGSFWNHAPVMREKMRDLKVSRPVLSSGEMADLVAFLTAYRYYLTELGSPADPQRGRDVFERKRCAVCHGAPGDWSKAGPSLESHKRRFSAIFLAETMWNHGAEMAALMRRYRIAWPKFEGREMGDLIAYLQAGNEGRASERVYFEPGSPRAGRDLFTRQCATCHRPGGSGSAPDLSSRGRDLIGSVSVVAGLMWNHSQSMTAEFARRGIPRVKFSGQEMADVIAYLYFINYARVQARPESGGKLFVRNCSTCHSLGGGTSVGPDLSTVPGLDEPLAIIAAMWNHAPKMEDEHRQRHLRWNEFGPGEAADLVAFLMSRRSPADVKPAVAAHTPRP